MWQQITSAFLGLWIIVASYIYSISGTGRALMLLTGIIVAILGFWGTSIYIDEGGHGRRWRSSI